MSSKPGEGQAQRGRALTSELRGGNQARIKATQSLTLLGRAKRLLPAEHGQITVRGDSGFYAVEAMMGVERRLISACAGVFAPLTAGMGLAGFTRF